MKAKSHNQPEPICWDDLAFLLKPRDRTAHKGHFGHVLVVGGAPGFGGAARLAAEAALRVGAGLVSLATHPLHVGAALAARPEIMAHGITRADELEILLDRCTVLAIGPGLGHGEWGRALWGRCRQSGRPMVVDADALALLAESADKLGNRIITPHPGEAGQMLGVCTGAVQDDRSGTVIQLQQRFGGVAVLKGAGTLIAAESKELKCCDQGNPGMASGGMGDLLTGIIAGLMAQGLPPKNAADAGVCLHAKAGDLCAARIGERGMLASDLLAILPSLVNPC